MSETSKFDGLVNAAIKIAHEDGEMRRSLKDALVRGDVRLALELACTLVNVQPSGQILEMIRDKAA
jgi:hypothetical protein